MPRPTLTLTLVLALASDVASTQEKADAGDALVRVVVLDSTGAPVPFALVRPHNRLARTASDSGVAEFRLAATDTMRFIVRRLGFQALDVRVPRDSSGVFLVRLTPLVQSLKAAEIVAASNELLARRGFYDRMERARRGAYTARFVTPEELDLRNPSRISQMMQGTPFVKMKYERGRAMLLGRTQNCPMTVLIDGHKMDGMIEEFFTDDGQREMERLVRTAPGPDKYVQATAMFMGRRQSIDDLVTAHAVVAIEMYGSMAAAPVELVQASDAESCGLIALWAGSRRGLARRTPIRGGSPPPPLTKMRLSSRPLRAVG